jgi:hypothetical protein
LSPEVVPSLRAVRRFGVLMSLLAVSSSSSAGRAATEAQYWQQSFPELVDPSPDFRPKVRSRPMEGNLEALAAAGFGAVEVGIDFRAAPEVAQKALRDQLLQAQRLGIHLDLAPGGSQPYESPGISEADSMQQLVSEHVSVQGGTDYTGAVHQPEGLA